MSLINSKNSWNPYLDTQIEREIVRLKALMRAVHEKRMEIEKLEAKRHELRVLQVAAKEVLT